MRRPHLKTEPTALEYRADRLFGRDADIARLLQRTRRTGLTAVVGERQIGTSWLLMELARRLDRETDPRCLLGFTRSPYGATDPLMQVVGDLYQRWLDDAGAWERLKAVREQQRDGFLTALARFAGKLSEKAAKLAEKAGLLPPLVGEMGGPAINGTVEGLVSVRDDLRNGQLVVAPLEYAEAQWGVGLVRKIADRHIALVLDQWERSRDLSLQQNTFRDFLCEPEKWPNCHILVGAREGGEAAELLSELQREFPRAAYVHRLGTMDLAIETERRRLISFLRDQPQLRAIENIENSRVLELIGGYPRVIDRWTARRDVGEKPPTIEDLEREAREAHQFRNIDLEKRLAGLGLDHRKLAIRVALVPLVEDSDAWHSLRSAILAGLEPGLLDDLKLTNVLDREAESPSFGNGTKRDAARSFLGAKYREAVRAEAELLILKLGAAVAGIDRTALPFLTALVGLGDTARQYGLGEALSALCDAASSVLGVRVDSPDSLIQGASEVRKASAPGLGLVLAAAVYNTLCYAEADQDAVLRDRSLEELRSIAQAYPGDAAVRQPLAMGLYNALIYAARDPCRRKDLLKELLDLFQRCPNDHVIRGNLAAGLGNSIDYAERENDFAYRDELMDKLRKLAQAYKDDAYVRGCLAEGLNNTLVSKGSRADPVDDLLKELRMLYEVFPKHAMLAQSFASPSYS